MFKLKQLTVSPLLKSVNESIFLNSNLAFSQNCKQNWAFSVSPKKSVLGNVPLICGERNCPVCYKNRVKKTKGRLYGLWKSLRYGLPTKHIILNFESISLEEYNRSLYNYHKSLLKKFTRWLNSSKYNGWGFGVFEFKYDFKLNKLRPHVHMLNFGYCYDAESIQSKWTEINGIYRPTKVKYGFSKTKFKGNVSAFKTYNEKRKFAMLDYFSRRVAAAGLIIEDRKNPETGKNQEVVVGSLIDPFYSEVVKRSRLYFSFGKQYRYKIYDDREQRVITKKTNIPKGLLHKWLQWNMEKEQERMNNPIYYLGTIEKPSKTVLESIKFDRLKQIYDRLADENLTTDGIHQSYVYAKYWFMAFQRLLEELGIQN